MTNKQMMWCIAAALAAGGVMEPSAFAEHMSRRGVEAGGCEELDVPVHFGPGADVTHEGYLRTTTNYAVRIDRVTMNPCRLEVSKERTAEVALEGMSVEGGEQAMQLSGVSLIGRVFDLSDGGERLPGEGMVIEGQVPVDVLMRKARRVSVTQPWKSEAIVEVNYTLPTHFFDEMDWGQLKG